MNTLICSVFMTTIFCYAAASKNFNILSGTHDNKQISNINTKELEALNHFHFDAIDNDWMHSIMFHEVNN